jgi:hypothetical protein
MKVSELKTEMDGKFAAVDQELKGLREQVTSETTTLSQRFDEMDERIKSEGEATRRHFDELDKRITSEGEATRRHFDVVAEKMLSERNLVLDRSMATAEQLAGLTASNAGDHVRLEHRLDDHARRLEAIERDRNAEPL